MNPSLLQRPLIELQVSDEFLAMAKANDFNCLQDVLSIPLHEIHALPESGYRMLRELVNFIDANNLSHLAKS